MPNTPERAAQTAGGVIAAIGATAARVRAIGGHSPVLKVEGVPVLAGGLTTVGGRRTVRDASKQLQPRYPI